MKVLRCSRNAALLFIVLFSTHLSSFADDSACPCINPWSDTSSLGSYYDSSINRLKTDSGDSLPIDFGASVCNSHSDGNTIECSGSNVPDCCSGLWCYVDTNNCLRPHHRSSLFSGLTVYYSFETCGNLDSYTTQRLLEGLKQRTLRVAAPDSGVDTHHLYWQQDGTARGATVQFFTQLFAHHQISWYWVGISQGSLDRYPWPYSACVHDVALNLTDICIGDFWPLPERRQMTTFAHTLEFEPLHLISWKKDNNTETFVSIITRPFVPYKLEVWLCILSVVLLFAMLFWLVETFANDEDFPHKGFLNSFGRGLYLSIHSFLSAAPSVNPVLPAGRILNLAFGIFILLTISTYTANLASFFVKVRQSSAAIESMEDAVERTISVCGGDLIRERLLAEFPELEPLFKIVDFGPDIVDFMDNNTCGAVITEKKLWEATVRGYYSSEDPKEHCDKIMLALPVTMVAIAAPVRQEIEQPISWAVSDGIRQGWWREASTAAFDTYFGKQDPLCKQSVVGAIDQTRDPDSTALSLVEMGGTFILAGFLAMIALLVFLFDLWRRRQLREMVANIRDAGMLSRLENFNPAEEDDEYKGTEGGNTKQQVAACLTFCKAIYDSLVEAGQIKHGLRRHKTLRHKSSWHDSESAGGSADGVEKDDFVAVVQDGRFKQQFRKRGSIYAHAQGAQPRRSVIIARRSQQSDGPRNSVDSQAPNQAVSVLQHNSQGPLRKDGKEGEEEIDEEAGLHSGLVGKDRQEADGPSASDGTFKDRHSPGLKASSLAEREAGEEAGQRIERSVLREPAPVEQNPASHQSNVSPGHPREAVSEISSKGLDTVVQDVLHGAPSDGARSAGSQVGKKENG